MPARVLERVKRTFESRFGRIIESLEAVRVIPRLDLSPLLICHDALDPLLPHHNALDVLRALKDSRLLRPPVPGTERLSMIRLLSTRRLLLFRVETAVS
jgi:hypothetical protein